MIKPTLNPPLDSRSNDAPVVLLRVKGGIPTEDLLINLTETLASTP